MSTFKISSLSNQLSESRRTANETYVKKAGGDTIGGSLSVSNLDVTGALTKGGRTFTPGGLPVTNVTQGITTIPSNGYSASIVSVPSMITRRVPTNPLVSYGRVELGAHNNVSLVSGASITLTLRHDLGDSNYLVYSTPDDMINVQVCAQSFGLNSFQMVVKNVNTTSYPTSIVGVNYQIVQCQASSASDVITLAQPVTVGTSDITLQAWGPNTGSNVFALSAASDPQGYPVVYTFAAAAPARTSVVDGSNICYFTTGATNTSSFTLIAANPYVTDVTKTVAVSLYESGGDVVPIMGAAAMVLILSPAVLSRTEYTYVPDAITYPGTLTDRYSDDLSIYLLLNFPFWWNGKDYGKGQNGGIYLSPNGYLTFGGASGTFYNLSGTNPPYPTVFLGARDMAWSRVKVNGSGARQRVMVEGYSTRQTSSAAVTYELSFEENGQILFSAIDTPNYTDGYCALTDGKGKVFATYTLTAQRAGKYTQYVFGKSTTGAMKITIPFRFVLNGVDYGNDLNGGVYISNNSYITFGATPTESENFSASSPNKPTIFVGSGNWTYQNLYTYNDSAKGMFRVRYEGSNNIAWEIVFRNNNNVYLCVEKHSNSTNTSGISNGTGTWLKSFSASPGPIVNITPT